MHAPGKRAWFVIGLGVLAVPLATAALAYGCTAIATLTLSSSSAPPGSTVTVNGKGFGTHDPASLGTNGLAEIRLGSISGPVLATASPTGAERTFNVQITVPQATPGDTYITATQQDATNKPVYGTPARQAFMVTAQAPRATTPSPSGMAATGQTTGGQQASNNSSVSNNSSGIGNTKTNAKIAKAVKACNKKYNPGKAKSKKGKKRSAAKRAACIKKAKA